MRLLGRKRPGRVYNSDIDKQESKRVPLDLQTFIDFIVFD
jgi:hypothetical protein